MKGKVKSCGCIKKERSQIAEEKRKQREAERLLPKPTIPYKPPKDYTNHKIGHITVLYWCGVRLSKRGIKQSIWYCRCDCGSFVIKTSTALRNANAHCGCVLYEERKTRALARAKEKKEKIIKFLQDNGYSPKDDIDHKHRRIRRTIKHYLLIKFPNGCAICGNKGSNNNRLCAHHYKPHALYPKLRIFSSRTFVT